MRLARRALLAAPLAPPALGVLAQAAWPDRPVLIILPFAAGGTPDVSACAMAPHFAQAFVVENKPGAGAAVGTAVVAKATDGHPAGPRRLG